MSKVIEIRDIIAKPGEKSYGFLDIAETASTQIKIPVAIVNGAESGPILCVTAGVHSTEYEGIEAAIRTFQNTNPRELKGALVICPVINTPGFQHGTLYVNPLDGENMNRVYPGKKDGTISERMIFVILNELIRLCDAHIDLHGGEPIEDHAQCVLCIRGVGTKEVEEKTIQMARYFLPKIIHESTNQEDQAFPAGTSNREVIKIGIPSITSEAGGLGAYRVEDIQFHMQGITNVMKWLGMLPKEGSPELPSENILVFHGDWIEVKVKHGGVFYPFLSQGDSFNKGERIAEVKDLFGNLVEVITAPEDGVIGMMFPKRVKTAGESCFYYWPRGVE